MTKEEKESLVIRMIAGAVPADQTEEVKQMIKEDPSLERLYTRLQALYEITEDEGGQNLRGATKRYDNILLASKLRAGGTSDTSSPPPQTASPALRWRAHLEDQMTEKVLGEFKSGATLLGAVRPCRIRIEDSQVSGVHARFLFSESTGDLWIEDLDSTNGTYILQGEEKVRLAPPAQVEGRDYWLPCPTNLRNGDRLVIGKTTMAVRITRSS